MKNRSLTLLLSTFLLLALTYSVVNPLHEATDELRHYRFVQHILQRRALPVQGEVGCSAQGHHPPLFYTLSAIAAAGVNTGRDVCYDPPKNPFWAYRYWEVGKDNKNQYLHGLDEAFPWRGEALAAHIMRAVNVLIGTAVIWITYAIGRTIWPKRASLALGGAAIVAFNPMFLYMAGAINNDVIAALGGAAITLACAKLLRDPNGLSRRWGIIFGTLFGLALMSKFNLAAMALPIGLTATWVAWRKKQWPLWWQVGLLTLFMTALVAGWWFVRNQLLYGEPTGFQRLTELWGVRNPSESFGVAVFELPYAWTSLWGRFGYGQIPLPQSVYDVLYWIALIALLGTLLPLVRRQKQEWAASGTQLGLLFITVITFFGVLFNYLLVSPAGPMGRFFFPALPALGLLIFYGLAQWGLVIRDLRLGIGKRPTQHAAHSTQHLERQLAGLVVLGMLALSLTALFGYLQPAYARPFVFDGETAVSNPTNAQFDSFVILRGYHIQQTTLRPGEPIDIDLYWEVISQPPGDYLLFVHLVDANGILIAQRDTHPGLGNYPSSQWQSGDKFVDTIRLFIPETAYTPTQANLSVGLYAPGADGYRLGITAENGTGLGDNLPLSSITLNPAQTEQADIPNPLSQNFANQIELIGYAYNQRQLHPGDTLSVTLHWQALKNNPNDYFAKVTLLDETGQVITALTSPPLAEQAPPHAWQQGQSLVDVHHFAIDTQLPPGNYTIHVALIDSVSKIAENIVAEDGHWIDNQLSLAKVSIQP